MKEDLQELLEYCIDRKKSYDNPATYQDTEYYDSCRHKSEEVSDIIEVIKQLLNEKGT